MSPMYKVPNFIPSYTQTSKYHQIHLQALLSETLLTFEHSLDSCRLICTGKGPNNINIFKKKKSKQ